MNTVKKIDIHVHTSESAWICRGTDARYATPEELIHIYDTIGVEKGVILPEINVEGSFQISSNYEIWNVVQKYPHRFAWFANLDPRQGDNSPHTDFTPYMKTLMSHGARGVGEICSNMYFDDPFMLNMFRHCEKNGLPVIFHIGNMGGDYGIVDTYGLPHLEAALQACPNLKFLGHSQKFWSAISGDVTEADWNGYPSGKVVPGGRLVELFRKYPNLCGDLSAGSGYNAVSRDPDFGYAFMEEFQDRLYYGTDICSPTNITSPMLKLASFLDEGYLSGKLSWDAYYKISRGNAEKILGLS